MRRTVSFSDVFPTTIDPSIPADRAAVMRQKIDGENVTTIMSEGYDENGRAYKDDLKALKAQLDARRVKLGGLIGVGGMGGITYNLLDKQDKIIPAAVLRVDPAEMVTPLEPPNPAAIRPIMRERVGYFAATIVPRAERTKDLSISKVEDTLAVLNAEGKLSHLKDLGLDQFMTIPGMKMPVLTDLSCVSTEPNTLTGMGTLETFLTSMGMDEKAVKARKTPPAEMAELHRAQDEIHERALRQLREAGINMDTVPTVSEQTQLQAVNASQKRGVS